MADGRPIPFRRLGAAEHCLLVEGWVCHAHALPDGTRQISDVLVAGDLLSQARSTADPDAETIACGTAHLAVIRADARSPLVQQAVQRLCAAASQAEAVRLRARLVSLGRRDARARIAHFFLDSYARLQRVGLAGGGMFRCPLTQEQLADVLGLTAVHVNRTLQRLRAGDLLMVTQPTVLIPDPDRLRAVLDDEHAPAIVIVGDRP